MIRYVIIFISIIFATTAPARANWQNTKWGMPVENVLAVVPKSTRYTDTRIDKQEETVEVAAAYEANGMLFVAFFYFAQDGLLSSISLVPRDLANCYKLDSRMAAAYGEPDNIMHGNVTTLKRWRDTQKGNMVSLLKIGPKCEVNYWPISSGQGL